VGTNGSSTKFKMYTVPGNTQYYTVKLFQIKNEIHVPLPCVVLLLPVIFCTNTNSADVKINTHCACTHRKVFSFTCMCTSSYTHIPGSHLHAHLCTPHSSHISKYTFCDEPVLIIVFQQPPCNHHTDNTKDNTNN
jgi:hypothetical protein